jgi:hypothetical protein
VLKPSKKKKGRRNQNALIQQEGTFHGIRYQRGCKHRISSHCRIFYSFSSSDMADYQEYYGKPAHAESEPAGYPEKSTDYRQ